MSLAELTEWCDQRFGPHIPIADQRARTYDIPWLVVDNNEAESDFDWRPNIPMKEILSQIACHAERNPGWLERSGV